MAEPDRPPARELPTLFPAWFERFQIKFVNPLVAPLAGRFPFFSQVRHRGRRSGKEYRTTVRAFTRGRSLSVVLVHGKTDWVKNVLACGGASVDMTRRTVEIANPRILPARSTPDRPLPAVTRLFLRRTAILVADIV